MIEITITPCIRVDGYGAWDRAEFAQDAKSWAAESRSGAICELARQMRSDGVPDQPWKTQTGLSGASLYWMADRTVVDHGVAGVKYRKWEPSDASA